MHTYSKCRCSLLNLVDSSVTAPVNHQHCRASLSRRTISWWFGTLIDGQPLHSQLHISPHFSDLKNADLGLLMDINCSSRGWGYPATLSQPWCYHPPAVRSGPGPHAQPPFAGASRAVAAHEAALLHGPGDMSQPMNSVTVIHKQVHNNNQTHRLAKDNQQRAQPHLLTNKKQTITKQNKERVSMSHHCWFISGTRTLKRTNASRTRLTASFIDLHRSRSKPIQRHNLQIKQKQVDMNPKLSNCDCNPRIKQDKTSACRSQRPSSTIKELQI